MKQLPQIFHAGAPHGAPVITEMDASEVLLDRLTWGIMKGCEALGSLAIRGQGKILNLTLIISSRVAARREALGFHPYRPGKP